MRTQRYLPGTRNGSVAKRQTRSKNPATSKAFGTFGATKSPSRARSSRSSNRISSRAGNRRHGEGRGSRVMWTMILIGIALCAGFVFALRSQINTYRLGQAEEQLRVKLDEYTSQQKFLTLDQQRALNTGESDRAGRQNGLDQLKLDQPAVLHSASVQRVVHQVPPLVKAPHDGQSNRLNGNGQNGLRSIKQPVKPNSPAKAAKAAKVVKTVKAGKVMKSNVAKSNNVASRVKANVVKAKKQSNNQRQASRSQQRR